MELPDAGNLVDGRWVPSAADETLHLVDPSTGRLLTEIPAGCADDVQAAVDAAAKATGGWAATPAAERAAALRAVAARLRTRVDEIAEVASREGGKPITDSRGGVLAGIGALEQYAELGPVHRGRSLSGAADATDLMVYEPRGIAAVLTPWNDPVAISCQLLAAVLVTGNVAVWSPSERTPLCGVLLAREFAAELPPGVLGMVLGDARAGAPLAAHPLVDVVLHVGSTATGRAIAAACARTGAKAVLENGGKDALVVDADVDPVWAAGQAASGAFANAGQICTSVERIYVHERVAEPFLAALVVAAEALTVGPALDPATDMGPLVDFRQRDVVDRHVRHAVASGATVLTGGAIPDGAGAFYPPTVLTGCTDDMRVMREETFGPVAAVRVVDRFDEALRAAADSGYALAATVLTGSMQHAQQAWRQLPVGTVKINAVWGGAPGGAAHPGRGSGEGFGYGPELMDEVTRVKVVHWQPPPSGT